MGKSSSEHRREGYQVGVFKNGRLKKIMKMKEGASYLKHKQKQIKEDRPKRECSKKQLEALAKGRAIREKNRNANGTAKGRPVTQRPPSMKNQHRIKEAKAQPHRKKAEKARVRREKEEETGKFRNHESMYTSDSDYSASDRDSD